MDDAEGVDRALAWERLDETVAFDCPEFAVRRRRVRLPDGERTDVHFVSEPPAVVVLPFTPDGDVVAIAEWREAVGRVTRGLPAGSIDPEDDDPATAARRELREETGYEAGRVDHAATVEPANGIADTVHHHFVARDCTPTAEADRDADESIRVEVRDYDALVDAAVAGNLRDGRAVNALLRHAIHR